MSEPAGPSVAIIPARGGSKRIPRKNIRDFLGVPLLARTVGMLHSTNLFDRVVVSTDDDEVAEVARGAGVEVPFQRNAALADDDTPTVPVVADALRRLGLDVSDARVCCVYPTAVLLQPEVLAEALHLLDDPTVDYVVPVAPFPAPIQRALRVTDDDKCEMIWPENLAVRTQDLEQTYHDAGQFYWGSTDAWVSEQPIFGPRTRAVVLPLDSVQDIDTEEDWVVAEQRFQLLRGGGTA